MTEILLQGLLLGGLYALFALGQSLMFGVMRLTNTAQGDFIILGGFFAISMVAATGLSPGLALLLIAPLAFLFGYALQRYVLNGTLGRDALPSLVVTFGLAIIIQNLLLEMYSADPRSLDAGPLSLASFTLGDITIGSLPLLTFGVAVLATALLQGLFSYTSLGRSFRAVSDDWHCVCADCAGRHLAGDAHDSSAV
jgi:branched-chain amino acid transport system permease protein